MAEGDALEYLPLEKPPPVDSKERECNLIVVTRYALSRRWSPVL
jgi:hypothetical protein